MTKPPDVFSAAPAGVLKSPETLAVQAMGLIDPQSRAVVLPIHLATTFIRDADNGYSSGNVYSRPHNETVRLVEAVITTLEAGAASLVFGSGMSAAVAVFLALKPGDHILAPKVMYWALRNWLLTDAAEWGLETSFVDMSDLEVVRTAFIPGKTKLVWLETPANPLWTISDIGAISTLAHAQGALVAVDSTCATPVLCQPLALGADIVMHSATKYLNGHSDVLAGALTCAQPDAFWQRIETIRARHGMVLGPFEAFLLLRGLRTLHVRVRAACASAATLADKLARHPGVAQVLYPGLASHPGHALAARQMQGGFGGMLSIRLKGTRAEAAAAKAAVDPAQANSETGEAAAIRTAARVQIWKRATSLGGVESLIEHRASIEGSGTPCPPDLLRLSVGLEPVEALYADLAAAMAD